MVQKTPFCSGGIGIRAIFVSLTPVHPPSLIIGIAVRQKKPLSPPQQYSMEHNAAYSAFSIPNTSTTATAATIAEELSRGSFRSQTPTASVGKYAGNCFIVEDHVYEVPQ